VLNTEEIINALEALGVEGPAVAVDVLRATNLHDRLYAEQLATIMQAKTAVMADRNQERLSRDG
jgi:hypothetical protein